MKKIRKNNACFIDSLYPPFNHRKLLKEYEKEKLNNDQPDKIDRNIKTLKTLNIPILDVKKMGEYKMILIKTAPILGTTTFQIGLWHKDKPVLLPNAQKIKYKPEDNLFKYSNEIKNAIIKWIDEYGPLTIASHNERKIRIYFAILKKLGFVMSTNGIKETKKAGINHFYYFIINSHIKNPLKKH